ncbi:MAG: PEP-CTERM sorting domain-containing protein [Luteolibacter sp.]
MKTHRLLPHIVACLAVFSMSSHAAVLLQDVALGGVQQTVYWEGVESNGMLSPGGYLSSANPTGIPTAGVGTVAPIAPGYRASLGYYSFTGHFGMTASTSIQGSAFSDIQSVVFQRVSMPNTTGGLTLDDNLLFDGGATLSLYSHGTLVDTIVATYAFVGSETAEGDPNTGFPGTFYNFTYQWDLSGYTEEITSVSVDAPIIVHSATAEARLDISSNNAFEAVPEPSTALLGALASAFLLVRRRHS